MIAEILERSRREVQRRAGAALAGRGGVGALADLLRDVQASVERDLVAARRADEPPPACGRGCAACCTVNVATLAIEGAAVAVWLADRLGAQERAARARELLRFHDRVRWLEDEDRIASRETCPFLEVDGACAIHPVRPLACRSLSSLDAADCQRALREREARDGGGEVRMNLLQHALYTDAVAVLQDALARAGLDARCRDVSGMVGAFLADPELGARFLAGARLPLE